MRKLLVIAMCLVVLSSLVMAQSKLETKWHCGKSAAEKSFDVGDVAGHSYAIAQGTCDATSSSNGEKMGAYTEFEEIWKASVRANGRFNVTTDNGDKTYYTYQANGDPTQKTVSETWKIVSGTGNHTGAKGSGTCTGKLNDDGSSDWNCTGTISAGK
jgi:hypothetical protein